MKAPVSNHQQQVAAARALKFIFGTTLTGAGIGVFFAYFLGTYDHSDSPPFKVLLGGCITILLGLWFVFKFRKIQIASVKEQLTPAQERKRFRVNLASGFAWGAIYVLLGNLLGICDKMPPITQVIVFGSAAVLYLLYMFLHHKP